MEEGKEKEEGKKKCADKREESQLAGKERRERERERVRGKIPSKEADRDKVSKLFGEKKKGAGPLLPQQLWQSGPKREGIATRWLVRRPARE